MYAVYHASSATHAHHRPRFHRPGCRVGRISRRGPASCSVSSCLPASSSRDSPALFIGFGLDIWHGLWWSSSRRSPRSARSPGDRGRTTRGRLARSRRGRNVALLGLGLGYADVAALIAFIVWTSSAPSRASTSAAEDEGTAEIPYNSQRNASALLRHATCAPSRVSLRRERSASLWPNRLVAPIFYMAPIFSRSSACARGAIASSEPASQR